MSRDHFPDRRTLTRLPPFQPFDPSCSTWPECGCDEECEAAERKRVQRVLRPPILGSVEIILIAAILALAAFAITGAPR